MGRPPLHLTRTHIAFTPETLERIDAIVGQKGRSDFVRKAVDQLLDLVDLVRSLEQAARSREE